MDPNYVSVPLGQSGKIALVDSEDAERVAMHNWIFLNQGQGPVYAYRMVRNEGGRRTTERLHRFILNASPGVVVDHVNGNGLDNRRANLRVCSQVENMQNQRRARADSTTGILNVHPFHGRYRVRVKVRGHEFHIGLFDRLEDAAAAAGSARRRLMPASPEARGS